MINLIAVEWDGLQMLLPTDKQANLEQPMTSLTKFLVFKRSSHLGLAR